VSWFPQSGLFMCPCHGGVYYADGKRASGPPPRGLFRCKVDKDALKKGKLRVQAPHYPTLQDPLDPQDKGEEA
jgi:Rieske Fe-S protein